MDEVTFSNVAPVIEVRDLKQALRQYRMLGFSTRAYAGPARMLSKLADAATEPVWSGDLFSYDNPRWQEVGVLVNSVDKNGKQRLTLRNSHQTHRAAAQVLLNHLGITTL